MNVRFTKTNWWAWQKLHEASLLLGLFSFDSKSVAIFPVSSKVIDFVMNVTPPCEPKNVYLNAKVSQPFNICVFFSMVQVRIFI